MTSHTFFYHILKENRNLDLDFKTLKDVHLGFSSNTRVLVRNYSKSTWVLVLNYSKSTWVLVLNYSKSKKLSYDVINYVTMVNDITN